MLCTRLRLKTPPPGTSAAVRYTCNHDQQGVQPRGFSGRWGLQPGFHLSAEEILQSCNMTSYSHITLQKKKKTTKIWDSEEVTNPKTKPAVTPATYNLAREIRRKTRPTVQIRHCPFSSASPISVFTAAPQRKQPSPNLCCFFQTICRAELLFANICI